MCCSRDHYPDEVGIHEWEGRHHHIILPWSETIAICVSADVGDRILVRWSDFDESKIRHGNIVAKFPIYDEHVPPIQQKAMDILTIGIAEGGKLSQSWVKDILQKRFPEEKWAFESGFPFDSFKIEPPEALEYHEWLAWQVMKEKAHR